MKIQFKSEYMNEMLLYNHSIKQDQQPRDFRTHFHDRHEIIFVKEGNISYQVGETTFSVGRHSLIFTRPGVRHRIWVDGDSDYDRYNFLYARELIPEEILAKIPENIHVINFETNPIVLQLFDKMDYYCENLGVEEMDWIIPCLLTEALTNVLIRIGSINAEFPIDSLTARIVGYIEENIRSIQDVDAVCEALSISKSYLYQIFLQDLRTTPKRYIVEKRLNMARRDILLGTNATAVYSQYGFSDYSAFFRAYKKQFGYSPADTPKAVFIRDSSDDVVVGHVV